MPRSKVRHEPRPSAAPPQDDFWATRPAPAGDAAALRSLVTRLHEAIVNQGAGHRRTREILADLLDVLAPHDPDGELRRAVAEHVAGGGDVALQGHELVLLGPSGEPRRRIDLGAALPFG